MYGINTYSYTARTRASNWHTYPARTRAARLVVHCAAGSYQRVRDSAFRDLDARRPAACLDPASARPAASRTTGSSTSRADAADSNWRSTAIETITVERLNQQSPYHRT